MDKTELARIFAEDKKIGALPPMNPDVFDKFLDYVHRAVDLRSFAQSPSTYRAGMYRRFLNSLPAREREKILFKQANPEINFSA